MKTSKTALGLLVIGSIYTNSATASDSQRAIDYQKFYPLVQPIIDSMTLDQKLGQMVLPKYTFFMQKNGTIDYTMIGRYALGAVLAAGGEIPDGKGGVDAGMNDATAYLTATQENWQPLVENTNANAPVIALADGSKVTIPLLLGIDAVHGMHEVLGNVIFPHNIGLSATHDPALVSQIGHATAEQLLKQGFNWTYAPTVAISHNPDWGRSFETLGSDPNNVYQLAFAMVNGLQQNSGNYFGSHGVLATVKHFIGDGATYNGIDQGDAHVDDFDRFFAVNAAGYRGAVDADAGSLMVSYSAINNTPMSINASLLAKLRAGELTDKPYTGLIVSDYGAAANLTRGLPTTTDTMPYPQALATAVNAGIDLIMISNTASYKTLSNFMEIFKQAVVQGKISEQRIDQAVTHILAVKYSMGLIHRDANDAWQHQFKKLDEPFLSNEQQQNIALQAAEQSLVLLKNEQKLLPAKKEDVKYIVLVGDDDLVVLNDKGGHDYQLVSNYDNIGAQAGGWTVSWQGVEGNTLWQGDYKKQSGATTIIDGLAQQFPGAELIYPEYKDRTDKKQVQADQEIFIQRLKEKVKDMTAANTIMIGVLAEPVYAEFMGDIANPYCKTQSGDGCLYDLALNPYLPKEQKTSLLIDYNKFDYQVINEVRAESAQKSVPLVTVLFSGRPMIISEPSKALSSSEAFIAAWLPGTAGGQAIANALSGEYSFCGASKSNDDHCNFGSPNTLPVNWVRNQEQLRDYPVYGSGSGFVSYGDPLYPINYGLGTGG